ncbi:MAG: Myxococcus phage Mx8 [Pseudomonadota bacterium]
MSSVYARGNQLWFRVKRDGKWTSIRAGFSVGEEKQALAALRKAERTLAAEDALGVPSDGRLTVAVYAATWVCRRQKLVRSWRDEESRLRLYILPKLGHLLVAEVQPREVAELVRELRTRPEPLAPKTVHNAYAVLRSLFRDAQVDGLVQQTPCVLSKHQLGKKADADPEWRSGAWYGREELLALVLDDRIPLDRRVFYALQGIAGCRHGEAAGLRWRNVTGEGEPLGRLRISTSYDTGRTKTGDVRHVPIHPLLGGLLKGWQEGGWETANGRAPTGEDLVCPHPPTARTALPRMRTPQRSLKLLHADLAALGLRQRRGHDFRRTFISLAREDGADVSILRRVTHKAPRDIMEDYTSVSFATLCREVLKLKLEPPRLAEVVPLALAVGAGTSGTSEGEGAPLATVLATVEDPETRNPRKPLGFRGLLSARSTGLEPVTFGVTGRRSNQLN